MNNKITVTEHLQAQKIRAADRTTIHEHTQRLKLH